MKKKITKKVKICFGIRKVIIAKSKGNYWLIVPTIAAHNSVNYRLFCDTLLEIGCEVSVKHEYSTYTIIVVRKWDTSK